MTNDEIMPTRAVHRSLLRPDREHLMGAERGLLVMLGAVAFILIWLTPSVPTVAVGVLLLVVGVPVLRAMAKRDPQFSRVVARRLNAQREYAAHGYAHKPPVAFPPQQKV